jgi:hypothetical protein
MFETLMLRLTTKVTRSPASSARSSSAAWRMSSMTSGRLSANIASSSSGASHAPSRARSIVSGRTPGCVRRGVNVAYRERMTSSTRGDCHSSFMYCG